MICTLCLKEIKEDDHSVVVSDKLRHKECSNTLEEMIDDLEKIYTEDSKEDI